MAAGQERTTHTLLGGIMSGNFVEEEPEETDIFNMTGAGDLYKARESNPYWYDDPDNPGTKIVLNPYDPSNDITVFMDRLNDLQAVVDGLDESTDWNAFIATATTVADTVFSDAEIQDAVTAFSNRQQLQLNRAQNDLASSFVTINAIQGSAFTIGQALLTLAHKQDTANYEADLAYNIRKERQAAIYNGAEMLRAMRDKGLEMHQIAAHLTTEFNRLKIVAMGEFIDESSRRARQAVQWNLEQSQFVVNLMAGYQGSALHPGRGDEVNTSKSTIGGALVGAQMGAQFGGGGMVVGALIGGAFGRAAAD